MKVLIEPLEFHNKFELIWAGIKSFADDCYRYYHREEVTVKIKSGFVKGFKISSHYDYRFFNFIGIPYAKPPVGELRFKVYSENKTVFHIVAINFLKYIKYFHKI